MEKFIKENWLKLSVAAIFVMVCLLLIISTINQTEFRKAADKSQDEKEMTDNFDRNQKCLQYKDEITRKIENKSSFSEKRSLEQIFYSPKQNSCLYVEYTERGEFYDKRLLDTLNDGASSKSLEICSSVHPSEELMNYYKKEGDLNSYSLLLKQCVNFDEKVSKYKY